MAPSMIFFKIHSAPKLKLTLWLPIFLLWPLGLVALVILIPLLLLAELILELCGYPIRLLKMLMGLLSIISSMRGVKINIDCPRKQTIVHVTIN